MSVFSTAESSSHNVAGEREKSLFNLSQTKTYNSEDSLGSLDYHLHNSKSGKYPTIPGHYEVYEVNQSTGSSDFQSTSDFRLNVVQNKLIKGYVYSVEVTATESKGSDKTITATTLKAKIKDCLKNYLISSTGKLKTNKGLSAADAESIAAAAINGYNADITYTIDGVAKDEAAVLDAWKAGRCRNKFAYCKNAAEKLIDETVFAIDGVNGRPLSGKALSVLRANLMTQDMNDFLNVLNSGGKPNSVSELNKQSVGLTGTVLQDTYQIKDDTTNIFAYTQPKKRFSVVLPEVTGYNQHVIYRPPGTPASVLTATVKRKSFENIIKSVGSLVVTVTEKGSGKNFIRHGLPKTFSFDVLDEDTVFTGANISSSSLFIVAESFPDMNQAVANEYSTSNGTRFVQTSYPASGSVSAQLTGLNGVLDKIHVFVEDSSIDKINNPMRGEDWALGEPVVRYNTFGSNDGEITVGNAVHTATGMVSIGEVIKVDPKFSLSVGSDNPINTDSEFASRVSSIFMDGPNTTKRGWVLPLGHANGGDPSLPASGIIPKTKSMITLRINSESMGRYVDKIKASGSGDTVQYVIVCEMVNKYQTDSSGRVTELI